MKKLSAILLALALTLCLTACGEGEATLAATEGPTEAAYGIANPWTDSDAAALEAMLGSARFSVPEGAENVIYRALEAAKLAEIRFSIDGMDYTARIQPAGAATDISGMYYDNWGDDEPCTIGGIEGMSHRATDGDKTIDVCQWYDAANGMMYSLSAEGADLDGFDIVAIAEAVYGAAQPDA